ncbi:MAG: hypothetical protein ACD_70C00139G0003 [uncultured bacterium]|nr:MAG: hypothetical protein ACD_70C00139G0003 [uncultured bacterium]OGT27000.1 MAG: hypothetical protein A3B71_04630 [Gammaproteobacteria bacterium RIFCSPHIGHO2_02_FULL_42_43]OGT53148.1 MAG: hypothetical protein A3E54_08490 [Gammaproteobacteria bacterium RIFCSPHIGHO2_12_FULL_41_25]OGT60977.1 MAG: hypothetical protein A3I77_00840 [Gammaproteobacteria bacterium RIFCSPLOWO2_02_FULL_42_14]OGT85293.1 MAG: hypothetical protein A3G86_05475 [Gammaproteobacteria bacterium RIFCSPLOWO2_12_FULL_42_18]
MRHHHFFSHHDSAPWDYGECRRDLLKYELADDDECTEQEKIITERILFCLRKAEEALDDPTEAEWLGSAYDEFRIYLLYAETHFISPSVFENILKKHFPRLVRKLQQPVIQNMSTSDVEMRDMTSERVDTNWSAL